MSAIISVQKTKTLLDTEGVKKRAKVWVCVWLYRKAMRTDQHLKKEQHHLDSITESFVSSNTSQIYQTWSWQSDRCKHIDQFPTFQSYLFSVSTILLFWLLFLLNASWWQTSFFQNIAPIKIKGLLSHKAFIMS